jgi:tetratricopeptide (TPR) repeat protein
VAHARDGQLERSIECDEVTLSNYRALGEIHPSYTVRLNLLSVAKRLAGKTGKIGSYERSYELLRECLSLARDLVDSMPTRINRLTEASVDLEAGKHLAMRRSHKNALKFFDRAIRSLRALYDEQPDLRTAELLAAAWNHSAGSNARLGRFVPAIATRRSALALLEEWQSHWSETDNIGELIELQRASIAALEQKSDEQDNA